MGSVFASSQPSTPPPPPPSTMRDEIGGIEQVPVRNPDGSITYVTRKLPLTAEEQAKKDEYDRIMSDALSEIERLSTVDFEADEETRKVLDAWEGEKSKLLEESFDDRETAEEKTLARRGLSDSSAASSVRRQRKLDRQEAEKQVDRESDMLSADIRNQQLGIQHNLYGIASSQDNLDQTRAYQNASLGLSSSSAMDASNRASLTDYYRRLNTAQMASQQSQSNGMFGFMGGGNSFGGSSGGSTGEQVGGAVGTAAGSYFGGPIGGAIGGAIGTAIGGSF